MRMTQAGAWSRALRLALVGALLSGAPSAFAQSEEEVAGARSAATQGAKAFDSGDYARAIDLFQRAESLVHAPPHLLYLARAHEKLGQLVTARELYNKIIRESLSDDAPQAFKDAQAAAREEIKAVEPRLAKLTVTIQAPPGVTPEVTMDGKPVPSALLGLPRPVDPGEHVLEVKAEGYLAAQGKATLAEGGTDSLVLTLEPDPNAAQPAAAPPAEPQPAVPAAPAQPMTPEDSGASPGGSLRVPAYVAFGVGAVGLGAGVFFTLQSASKRSDANDKYAECAARGVDGQCKAEDPLSDEVASLDDDAGSAKTMAIVGYALGGVGVAAGVTLLLLDDSSGSATAPRITPWVGYQSVGVTGTF